jgi:hypothetical protein
MFSSWQNRPGPRATQPLTPGFDLELDWSDGGAKCPTIATIGSLSNASDCIACQKRSRSFGNMLLKTLGLSLALEGVGQGKGSCCCCPTRRTASQTDEAGVAKPPRRIMDIPRITIEDLKRRVDAHEALAVLDPRAADAWKSSESQIPGSIRVPPDEVDKHHQRFRAIDWWSRIARDTTSTPAPVWRGQLRTPDDRFARRRGDFPSIFLNP